MPPIVPLGPLQTNGVQLLHLPVFAGEGLGVDGEIANLLAGDGVGLFVSAAGPENHRPVRPRLNASLDDQLMMPTIRWARKKLKLPNAIAPLANSCSKAIGAGVASAEDDDVLPFGVDHLL